MFIRRKTRSTVEADRERGPWQCHRRSVLFVICVVLTCTASVARCLVLASACHSWDSSPLERGGGGAKLAAVTEPKQKGIPDCSRATVFDYQQMNAMRPCHPPEVPQMRWWSGVQTWRPKASAIGPQPHEV